MLGKQTLVMALSLILPLGATAYAANGSISTGKKGGSYYQTGENLAALMAKEGHAIQVNASKGSIENLERLASGEATFGEAQVDAYAWWATEYPDKAKKVELLGNLYPECIYIAANPDLVNDEDDLQDDGENPIIAVGPIGSGSEVSWRYMVALESNYAASKVVNKSGQRMLGKIASGESGQPDAMLWVSRPTLDNPYLTTVLNNKSLRMIDVDDSDLNDTFDLTGKPVYEFQKIDIKEGFFNDTEVTVPCTQAALFGSTEAEEELLEDAAKILLNNHAELIK